jgi:hypothetical protein
MLYSKDCMPTGLILVTGLLLVARDFAVFAPSLLVARLDMAEIFPGTATPSRG